MQQAYHVVLVIHVALGSVALAAFWSALFAKKGGRQHRFRGRVFVWTMTPAVVTALALCLAVNGFDPFFVRPPGPEVTGAELAEYPRFIRNLFNGIAGGGVFALVSLVLGMRALRRGDIGAHVGWVLSAGVAGHVAFFVSVLPKLLPGIYERDPSRNPIPWLLPPLIGGIAAAIAARRASRRYAALRRPSSESESSALGVTR